VEGPPARRKVLVVVLAAGLVAVAVAAVVRPGVSSVALSHPVFGSPSPATTPCPDDWECAQRRYFVRAGVLLSRQPGQIGMVVRDRTTGLVWRGGEHRARFWAGSTPKLAMAVALREDARAGRITLDATARRQSAAMLSVSDNRAADALWDRFGDAATWLRRFRAYGMASAGYVESFPPRWGFIKCTVADLSGLMSYVLDTLHPAERAYIVDAMRTVGPVQRWGVWGAGPALRPGVKGGWSIEREDGRDIWITATVGFAGPDERYVVAAMYHQPPDGGSLARGVHGLTDLVATVFGQPVPAPAVVPSGY
jgi:hypothetical protein